MVSTHCRGHKIIRYMTGEWHYEDGQVFDDSRPCPSCGRMPGADGSDACLKNIPGAEGACCGHGDPQKNYIQYKKTA